MAAPDIARLSKGVLESDKASVSQALNLIEDRRPQAREHMTELLEAIAKGDRAQAGHRVGLTGPPGVGKSTLAAALARALRQRDRTVGVVAVDPSSVKSGGSLLGDRARMSFDPSDQGLFVRSLATGGEAGGLTYAANSAVVVLGGAYDVVLVETTGVGQTETDIMHVADTVVLVIQPGSGDVLQFLKAGIMEIPDIFVINKADHHALAQRAVSDLSGALNTQQAAGTSNTPWTTPIIATSATEGRGIDALIEALDSHREHLSASLQQRRHEGRVQWVFRLFLRQHGEHAVDSLGGADALRELVQTRLSKGTHPLRLSQELSLQYLNR